MSQTPETAAPLWLRAFIKLIKPLIVRYNTTISDHIPKYPIGQEALNNAKLLANRTMLLQQLPKNATVAELGVDQGGFSEDILKNCNPEKLHLIDFWGSKRYNQDKRKGVENKFAEELKSGKVEINLGLSTSIVSTFKDSYFDWISIDTDHKYKTTIQELELWEPKVKEGGIIAGHDYIIGNWNGLVRYGVIEAVYEFCTKHNWEIIYLSVEIDNNPSFAIRKIGA